MTAATVESAGLLEGAPRASVEDAWQTLNTRYAIGTGVLLAALALMWVVGLGPGAARGGSEPAAQAPGTAMRAAGETGGTTAPVARASNGDAAGTASSGPSTTGAIGSSTSAGASGAASSAAPAGAPTAGTGPAPAVSNGSASPPNATAPGAPNGANGSASAAAASLPKPVAGAPVARLYFEPSQSWPSGEVGPRLAPVLARLKAEPDTKALVSGFHDRRGSTERNAKLAQTRAQSVRRVLIREGIAADRIVLARPQQTQGSGPDREARRVEVTVAR